MYLLGCPGILTSVAPYTTLSVHRGHHGSICLSVATGGPVEYSHKHVAHAASHGRLPHSWGCSLDKSCNAVLLAVPSRESQLWYSATFRNKLKCPSFMETMTTPEEL
jgi:hypothetical protein